AVVRALTSDSRLLDAAERRALVGEHARVDADDPELERLADTPDARDVAREEVGGEAELGRVRQLDRLGLGPQAEDGRERPERLLACDLHLLRGSGDDRRLEERAAELVAAAADDHRAAALDGVGNVLLDLRDGGVVD